MIAITVWMKCAGSPVAPPRLVVVVTCAAAGVGGRQSAARHFPLRPGRVHVVRAPEAKPWSQTAVLWGSFGSWETAGVAKFSD